MKAKIIKTGEMVDVYHEPQHGQITNIYKECVLVNGRMWTEDELNFCMKANEAPEKIYVDSNAIGENISTTVDTKRQDYPTCTEYIRTDAFIEKACEYFRRGLEDTKVIDDYRNILVRGIQASYTSVEEFIENFKEYIEG